MIAKYRSDLRYGVIALVATLALLSLWPGVAQNLLVAQGFMPHGHCYLWKPELVWLHVISDSLIGLAYVSISATLVYLVRQARRDIPFDWIFLAFGLFIVACGGTHFMEVWTLWTPTYWLAGELKLLTASVSVMTAVLLPSLVPKVMDLLAAAKISEQRRSQLETANQDLAGLYQRLKHLDQLKTQFFANVSHELRTPLALILGPTEKLLATASFSPDQQSNLELVERNANILLKRVNDLLDVSRIESGRMTVNYAEVNLAQLVKLTAAYFETIAQERQIQLSVNTPAAIAAQVDPEKVQGIFLNLLSNAFKFTPNQGTIEVTLEAEPGDNPQAVIVVQDSGDGIPAEHQTLIFERFYQATDSSPYRFGSSGLGLAIVKEFVDLHGGEITVNTAPAGGARFTVKLPLQAPAGTLVQPVLLPSVDGAARQVLAELRPTIAAVTERQTSGKPLVLVVEDNVEMNWFITESLSAEYRTASALDGQEGLEKAIALQPDLILSDVMMPKMNGDELVRAVRSQEALSGVPIILLTAKADDDLRIQLLREGIQDYLMKPFSPEELVVRVGNLVTMKRTRQVLQEELASQSQDVTALVNEVATRKRELERAYEEAQRANQMKDEFLAVVSHELRTPLNAILGWSQMLKTRQFNSETTQRALETIERNAKQQSQLIDDILDISRIIRGKLRLNMIAVNPVTVVEAALNVVRPAAEAKQIQLDLAFKVQETLVLADPDRLQQIIWNLFSNAVKFTPEGGQITVSLARTENRVQIQVIDTGMGITADFLPHVFEHFRQADSSTTRSNGGLGLGLAIVQQLVELHGGSVWVDSPGEGQGTTFTVMLPIFHPAVGQSQVKAESEVTGQELTPPLGLPERQLPLSGLQALVVDDEIDARDLLITLLEQQGVQVLAVASAEQALQTLHHFHPDVLISDIGLPGQDGYNLIRQVRQLEQQQSRSCLPAIALTAYAREEDRRRTLAAGFQVHMHKPVDPESLTAAIAKLTLKQI